MDKYRIIYPGLGLVVSRVVLYGLSLARRILGSLQVQLNLGLRALNSAYSPFRKSFPSPSSYLWGTEAEIFL